MFCAEFFEPLSCSEESGAAGNEKKSTAQSTGAPASSDASVPGGANSGAASAGNFGFLPHSILFISSFF